MTGSTIIVLYTLTMVFAYILSWYKFKFNNIISVIIGIIFMIPWLNVICFGLGAVFITLCFFHDGPADDIVLRRRPDVLWLFNRLDDNWFEPVDNSKNSLDLDA